MASPKTTRSVRSMKSTRSSRVSELGRILRDKKGPSGVYSLDNMLTMACSRFQCPYVINVIKHTKQDIFYKNLKKAEHKVKNKRRISVMNQPKITDETDDSTSSTTSVSIADNNSSSVNTINVTMIYDNYNTLIELLITKVKQVPRILLTILNLLLPYYKNLKRITITKCGIDMYTVHELKKMLNASTISEICLDGSRALELNYAMLMETSSLSNLSLCRCNIDDDTCKSIAEKLHFTGSAGNLLLLNLSSNHITDEGVKYISEALRTNRRLRYLNLADNHITDCGVGHILDVLIEFPLTHDEILDSRRRRLEYLKRKNDLYEQYLARSANRSFDEFSQQGRKTVFKKRKTSGTSLRSKSSARRDKDQLKSANVNDDYTRAKVEMMVAEMVGPYKDPFNPEAIKPVDGYVYSLGNMTLSYLNVAYNNLTFVTVRKLLKVLQYQNFSKTSQGGLVKVVLEGNNFPVSCPELCDIEELLTRNTWRCSGRFSDSFIRKGRIFKGENK